MKSITVKMNGGVACFTSGHKHKHDEDGTTYEIEETDEEMLQSCYDSLIDSVKREEFEKNLIALLKNYKDYQMGNWKNIQIKINGDWNCEMNISNLENMDLKK